MTGVSGDRSVEPGAEGSGVVGGFESLLKTLTLAVKEAFYTDVLERVSVGVIPFSRSTTGLPRVPASTLYGLSRYQEQI